LRYQFGATFWKVESAGVVLHDLGAHQNVLHAVGNGLMEVLYWHAERLADPVNAGPMDGAPMAARGDEGPAEIEHQRRSRRTCSAPITGLA